MLIKQLSIIKGFDQKSSPKIREYSVYRARMPGGGKYSSLEGDKQAQKAWKVGRKLAYSTALDSRIYDKLEKIPEKIGEINGVKWQIDDKLIKMMKSATKCSIIWNNINTEVKK